MSMSRKRNKHVLYATQQNEIIVHAKCTIYKEKPERDMIRFDSIQLL